MRRKERMGRYIDGICKMLQHLPETQANELEIHALYDNLVLSHSDIAQKLRLET